MSGSDEDLLRALRADLADAHGVQDLSEVRRRYLGKKGSLRLLLHGLAALPAEDRAARAQRVQALLHVAEQEVTAALATAKQAELDGRLAVEAVDVTLPGLGHAMGALHPVTLVTARSLEVLRRLGFQAATGPEVELPYYNFDALNIPAHHPARDLQDTFWLEGDRLLRSHTTTVQARTLAASPELPVKVVSSGRVYRNEAVDATHLAMFHQLEGFWLQEGLTLAHLKGVLAHLARALYGQDQVVRFKPKYYPYTEPSLGLDLQCTNCASAGCQACHHAGWVTIMGAGMIHPAVLREFGYHRPGLRGLAFGWGTTRMTAQWLGVSKVRRLYESNARTLQHMAGGA